MVAFVGSPFIGFTTKVSSLQIVSTIAKISGVGFTVIVNCCVSPVQPLKNGVKVYTKSSARLEVFIIVSPKIGVVNATGPELAVNPLRLGPAEVTSHE